MMCLACGAEMHLMQMDQRGDLRSPVAFERHTFKCSVCPQLSQRLVFSRSEIARKKELPVVTPFPEPPAINLQERLITWASEVNELRKKRTEQAAAAKAMAWAKMVDKQTALKEREVIARRPQRLPGAAAPAPSATTAPVVSPRSTIES